ncbi:MAG TPA: hypothetical protein V6C58_07590 [Allocoleopsis sp.]
MKDYETFIERQLWQEKTHDIGFNDNYFDQMLSAREEYDCYDIIPDDTEYEENQRKLKEQKSKQLIDEINKIDYETRCKIILELVRYNLEEVKWQI